MELMGKFIVWKSGNDRGLRIGDRCAIDTALEDGWEGNSVLSIESELIN